MNIHSFVRQALFALTVVAIILISGYENVRDTALMVMLVLIPCSLSMAVVELEKDRRVSKEALYHWGSYFLSGMSVLVIVYIILEFVFEGQYFASFEDDVKPIVLIVVIASVWSRVVCAWVNRATGHVLKH